MTKAALIAAIQAVADATQNNNYRISLGAPGQSFENSIGEVRPTGAAWEPEPKSFPIIMEGIARYLGTARTMDAPGDLVETDHRIELIANNVTVSLPAAAVGFIGEYIIKAKGVTGGAVSGTIDGAPAVLPVVNWDFVTLYCNGSEWLTG